MVVFFRRLFQSKYDSEYTITMGGKIYPFLWSWEAIKRTKADLGKEFEEAVNENDNSWWDAYGTALYHGVTVAGGKIEREEIKRTMTQATVGQVIGVFNRELEKFTEGAGMKKQPPKEEKEAKSP